MMKKTTLEDRFVISPGDGFSIAPCAALPLSFTLILRKLMPLQIFSFCHPTVSLSCEGKKINDDAVERITLYTKKEKLSFKFEYIHFSDADRKINQSSPERKKIDINLIQETAYQIIHGKRSLNSQVQSLFDYVYTLPVLGTPGHPFESDQVIRYGIARKCVDKAQLFVDLCQGVDIPARYEDGIHAPHYSHHA